MSVMKDNCIECSIRCDDATFDESYPDRWDDKIYDANSPMWVTPYNVIGKGLCPSVYKKLFGRER